MSSFFEKLDNLDDRIVYLFVAIVVLIPLFKPMQLPLAPSQMSEDAFEAIDKLAPGSIIFLMTDLGPGNMAELLPQLVVIHKHAMSKGLRTIYASTGPESPPFLRALAEDWQDEFPCEYGKDTIVLPFKAGAESLIVQIGQNFRGLYDKDDFGTSLSSLELWQDISDVKDVDLAISLCAGDLFRWVVRHIQAPKGVPTIVACTAVITTFVAPFYSSGQFVGIISGLGGAADYEFMAGIPGEGVSGMDAQSLGHIALLALIALGNISGLLTKKEEPAA